MGWGGGGITIPLRGAGPAEAVEVDSAVLGHSDVVFLC